MDATLRFGLVPVHDDVETHRAIDALAVALSNGLGCACTPVRCGSPRDLANRFLRGEVDIAWSSPTLALTELRDAVPLVTSVRQGVAYYHGVLFVRQDSDIKSLLDARGRTVGWVAETSASGYLFARVALASMGFAPDSFFCDERFAGSHGAVAEAVASGEADVGATFAVFEEGDATRPLLRAGFAEDLPEDGFRILFCTPPIPSDLLVASKSAMDEYGPFLREAVLALAARAPDALKAVLGADEFMACRPRFFEQLRIQLEDARILGVLPETS
ncbi:MAG: phosphate/phosphite/phosphonate ABC transporter substrate-binding protein [Sandaracinaceae bacterium]